MFNRFEADEQIVLVGVAEVQRLHLAVAVLGVLLAATGCSRSSFPTASVRGVVLCQGTPVREGSLTFSPIPKDGAIVSGKPAVAVVDENGNFQLSTYSSNDGAILGRHRVVYYVPEAKPKSRPCGEMVVQEIEVTKGMGEITIELSDKSAR